MAAPSAAAAARRADDTVEFNREPTPLSAMVDVVLTGPAGHTLPAVVHHLV